MEIKCYKVHAQVDDGMSKFEVHRYVFATSEEKAKEIVVDLYTCKTFDTYAKVLEVSECPIREGMVFADYVAMPGVES